ncbi:carboxypeptidase-like regulatory domain-containing protein [uncultured Planktosalinus sp.]|uniref:carboxypeptidase-like regulatory domain-containing protein n=1 Tax=uncultured Planktosalinus sp. TaxID=1810935 RepID=UPI0030DB3119|tara:strand:+ start:147 stop:512 length:366 start_codon:yes stop_codon:yes gene_type:complete
MKNLISILVVLSILACNNDDDGIACTQEARAGLNVTVKDAATNNYLGIGTTVVATDGNYSEGLEYMDGIIPTFAGAWEREGNYILTISAEGYVTFVSETITVTSDECHVIPQQVEALLQPE